MSGWLITGATGLLGSNAFITLGSKGINVTGIARKLPRHSVVGLSSLDLLQPSEVEKYIQESREEVIFHTAAMARIEDCEKYPELAKKINLDIPVKLAELCDSAGKKFVFVSTDAVFSGEQTNKYSETDMTSPRSVYGELKLAAETIILEKSPQSLITRVNFYGWSPSGHRSLSEYFYNNLSNSEPSPGFYDVTVSTMYVVDLIETINEMVEKELFGLFHVASSEAITKFEFGKKIAKIFGMNPELVSGCLSSSILDIPRANNLSLSVDLVETALQKRLPGQMEGIKHFRQDLLSGYREHIKRFSTK